MLTSNMLTRNGIFIFVLFVEAALFRSEEAAAVTLTSLTFSATSLYSNRSVNSAAAVVVVALCIHLFVVFLLAFCEP